VAWRVSWTSLWCSDSFIQTRPDGQLRRLAPQQRSYLSNKGRVASSCLPMKWLIRRSSGDCFPICRRRRD